MILLYENALLTLQNGQETQNFPPRGGLFSDCFLYRQNGQETQKKIASRRAIF